MSPSTLSIVLVVSQSPYALELLNGDASPLIVISPEVLEILFVPVEAVPPHPISNPM